MGWIIFCSLVKCARGREREREHLKGFAFVWVNLRQPKCTKISCICLNLPAWPPLAPAQKPGWRGRLLYSPARISAIVFCICIYACMSFVIIQQPLLKNWEVLEVICGIWLARQSLQNATGSLRTLLTSRCFKRETFSRKDSYIFRFWNALLRTIFLNVERSIAHRDPLVWAWVGWTGVNGEEERRVARI